MGAIPRDAEGLKAFDPWSPPIGAMTLDPNTTHFLNISRRTCANPTAHKPTICDYRLRSLNVRAQCGSNEDFYYYSPWRAPVRMNFNKILAAT